MSRELSSRYQGVQKDSAGYKLLKSMGWKEGEGLGATKQGIKEHIRVKKKFENWGVGAVESHDRARDWSNGMSEFHRVLSSLSEITSKHAGSSENDIDIESNDDALDGLNVPGEKTALNTKSKGKKRSKEREQKGQQGDVEEGKKKKKKKRKQEHLYDTKEGNKTNISTDGYTVIQRKATHIGRFKKRETSKMVKGYSSSDLAAILGEDPFAKQNETIVSMQNMTEKENSDVTIPEDDSSKGHAADLDVIQGTEIGDPAIITNAWWSSYFVVGPKAGSKREKIRIKKKSIGFSEQDQENLYSSAHDHATTGRVGLGRSSMPKKVAGVRWAGTKTRLDSDSDDNKDNSEDDVSESDDESMEIQIVLPPKSPAAAMKGLIQEVLSKEKNKSMKLKSLVKHVVRSLGGKKNHVSGFIENNTQWFKITQDKKKRQIVSLLV